MESNFLAGLTVFDIIKWFLAAGLLMYVAFAVVILRQVAVMSEALEQDPNNGLIKIFAWAHLAMTILLLVVTLVIL